MNTTNREAKVGVCSRSFSRNPVLQEELKAKYKNAVFNESDGTFKGEALVEFLKDCDKAIIGLESVDDAVLGQLPKLKTISKYGVGLDSLDFEALRKHGIQLGWTGGVNKRAVAELALTFALALIRKVPQATRLVRGGSWAQVIGNQLTEKTFGILGLGRVGKELVQLLQPFGCKILAHDLKFDSEFGKKYSVSQVSFETLLSESKIVSIHLPLDNSTKQIIGKRELALMQPHSVLVNTARGNIVDENALKARLIEQPEFFAGFDVFHVEPPIDQELQVLENFWATPHMGGSAKEAVLAMGRAAIDNLDRAVEARPENFV